MKSRRRVLWATAVAALAFSVGACGDDSDGDEDAGSAPAAETADGNDTEEPRELRTVRVGTPTATIVVGSASSTSLPEALGYAAEEGIDLEPVGLQGSGAVMQAIDAGSIDMGFAGTETIAAAIAAGADVTGVFMSITGNVQVPQVLADSDIESFADFEGRTVGVLDLAATIVDVIKGSVQAAGADPESVNFVQVGQGAEALVALQQGRIDVLGFADTFAAEVRGLGAELRPVLDDEFRRLGATMALAVPRSLLEEDPELIIGVARAVAKSTYFATLNPEAVPPLHWEAYPESRPAGQSEEEALTIQTAIVEERSGAMQPVDGVWGDATDEQLEARLGVAVASGSITEGQVPLEDLFTRELLDDINDFDESAVEADAESYRS